MVKKRLITPLLSIFILCGLASSAWAVTAAEVLSKMEQAYRDYQGFTASYVRESKSPAVAGMTSSRSVSQQSTGTITFKRPSNLRLDQTKPRKELLVANTRTIWWHLEEDRVVNRYPAGTYLDQVKPITDFFSGLGNMEASFKLKLNNSDPGLFEVNMTSRKESENIDSITAWIS
ncbi:MAG: outer membrane lipoprotein carrier protein LolA, partial [Deltaproteobacteria bacterium]|nr:outer membrane lipoprotein carrier protein LolA [Deltaproteobacteria bacterium]